MSCQYVNSASEIHNRNQLSIHCECYPGYYFKLYSNHIFTFQCFCFSPGNYYLKFNFRKTVKSKYSFGNMVSL